MKKTRKFMVDGVEVSVTTSKIVTDNDAKSEEMRFLRYALELVPKSDLRCMIQTNVPLHVCFNTSSFRGSVSGLLRNGAQTRPDTCSNPLRLAARNHVSPPAQQNWKHNSAPFEFATLRASPPCRACARA